MMGWGWTGFGWLWMGLWTLIFIGGLVALIFWAVRRGNAGSSAAPRHAPLDIAKERYARGEISKEQFEQIKKDLS